MNRYIFMILLLVLISFGIFQYIYSQRILTPISESSFIPTPNASSPTITSSPTPTPPSVTIGLMGDLGLGRHITSTARRKNDFYWSFGGVEEWVLQNDFNLANLESPIIESCPEGKTGTFTFCGDTRFLPSLVKQKYILNLANNHMFNYGEKGFSQTKRYLSQNNISYFYSHRPDTEFYSRTVNGIRFGFLGYDFITNPNLDQEHLRSVVKKYDREVDWLVISLHWGNEYLPNAEKWRHDLARQLIEDGVDIVHGHHPHVWQEYEIYKNKPIFYSLGNFIFDQSWSYETSHSRLVRLTLDETKVLDLKTFPYEIIQNSRPELGKS